MSIRADVFLDVFSPDYRRQFGLFYPREGMQEPFKGEPLTHYYWLTDVLNTAVLLAGNAVFVPHAFVLQCPLVARLIERNRLLVRESLIRMPMGDDDVGESLEKMRRTYLRREFPHLFAPHSDTTVAVISEAAIPRTAKLGTGIVDIVTRLPNTHENGHRRWDKVPPDEVQKIVGGVAATLREGSPVTFEAVLERLPPLSKAARQATFSAIHYAYGIQHLREYGLTILEDIPGIHDRFEIGGSSFTYSYRRSTAVFRQLGLTTHLLRVAGSEGVLFLRNKQGFKLMIGRYSRTMRHSDDARLRTRPRIPLPASMARDVARIERRQLELTADGHSFSSVRALKLLEELANLWLLHFGAATELHQPSAKLPYSSSMHSQMRTHIPSREERPVTLKKRAEAKTPRVALLTIIGPEMDAIKRALRISERNRVPGGGELCYEVPLKTKHSGTVLLEVSAIGMPGNSVSAAVATKVIQRGAQFMLLCGIAAGVRGKVKIGDVVVPRTVVDNTLKVAHSGSFLPRPQMVSPLRGVFQMNACSSVRSSDWERLLSRIFSEKLLPEAGKEDEFKKNVAAIPQLHESAILSDNILLRDPSILTDAANDLHQQIRSGEMEAAGFVTACNGNYPPVPWFVIRGISDFGDQFKHDRFHSFATTTVAAYAALYLRHVLDVRIWERLG